MSQITKLCFDIIEHKMRREFAEQCRHPEDTQDALLKHLLRKNHSTAFGMAFGFKHITNLDQFRRNVPLGSYQDFKPYIVNAMNGKASQLTAEAPIFFANTSGTTGPSKWIPVTPESRSNNARVMKFWLASLNRDHPDVFSGRILSVVGCEVPPPAGCKTPCGAESGYAFRNTPCVLSRHHSAPYDVFRMLNYEAKYYTLLRIAAAQPISLIFAVNPSTILLLADRLARHTTSIIQSIHDGGLARSACFINHDNREQTVELPSKIRDMLRSSLSPDPKRARILQSAARNNDGKLIPRAVWPDLAAIGCWKGGTVGGYLNHFSPYFDAGTPVRDPGYVSSEHRGSVPLTDTGDAGVLTIGTNFYEFCPQIERDALQTGVPPNRHLLLRSNQLEVGRQYYVYVTTRGGLYRYDMNDIVEVVGFYERTPCIRFIRKGKGTVSLEGEKLTETQVECACRKTFEQGTRRYHFVLAHGQVREGPQIPSRYTIYVAFDSPLSEESLKVYADNLELALQETNIEYYGKRKDSRLAPVTLGAVKWGFEDTLRQRDHDGNKSDAQFKVLRITTDQAYAPSSLAADAGLHLQQASDI